MNIKMLKEGEKFFYLTVIKLTNKRSGRSVLWLCKCRCGKQVLRTHYALKNKCRSSCGCFITEFNIKRNTTHGMSKTKEYRSWKHMLERCNNKNEKYYKNYGGRGITVCKEWHSFESFYKAMGRAPSKKHSIDRINNNGNYEPSNCRWATSHMQTRNQRSNNVIRYKGQEKILTDWAKEYGLKRYTLFARLKKMSVHQALTRPILKPKKHV